MFRRSKRHVLTAPLECFLIDEHRMLTGTLLDLSLHGAFVAITRSGPVTLDEGAVVCLSTRLEEPLEPALTFAIDQGALVWSNRTQHRLPDPIVEARARVVRCRRSPHRLAAGAASGVALQFILTKRAQHRITTMISELHYRNRIEKDAPWFLETPESRGKRILGRGSRGQSARASA